MNKDGNELVETLLGIWREVLVGAAPHLDADSNFFLNGGDSLDLARVLVRVRERLGVELELRAPQEFSTPRKMARRCALAMPGHGQLRPVRPDASSPAREGAGRCYPCSSGQRALWIAEQMADSCGLYNTAVALHMSGPLQVPVLARALGMLLLRHEVLRSRLRPDLGARQLVASIDPAHDVVLEPHRAEPAMLRQCLLDAAALPFVLDRGALWRFRLFTTGPASWTLLLCLHHMVTDGWSGSVLLGQLAAAYNALLRNQPWQAQPRDGEFAQWCLRQAAPAAADLGWWRAYLDGADRLRSWPATGALRWPFAMECEQAVLTQDLAARIAHTMRALGLPPSALFLTALRLVLAQCAGLRELCIGVPANIRDSSAQEAAVGYFVNLLVTRATLAEDKDPRAALYCVHDSLGAALRHRAVPFATLAHAIRPALLPSGNAWCDVLFAFQNLPHANPRLDGLHTRVEALPLPYGQHPLKLEVLCLPAGYACRLEYARASLTASAARALLAALQDQVEGLLACCARSS